ncbi:hypothetical protein JCM1393_15970 [Clostridium carnis]
MISKKKVVIISLSIFICFISTLVASKYVNVNASIGNRPDFDIEISAPDSAMVGEDILVSGVIKPKPFETEVPPKEIVMVLDISGSMRDQITGVRCNNTGYCEEHNSYYRHYTTKMYELKKAAKNFVEKMKNVPNLKIGIVTYSTEANIQKRNNYALIPADKVNTLNSIIDGLKADGGTNTGEGLRKATYLLDKSKESNPNANKTIVLMSDGIPTFRTVYIDDWIIDRIWEKYEYGGRKYWTGRWIEGWRQDHYIDINTERYNTDYIGIAGWGYEDDSNLNTRYAKEIGEIINIKGYNTFSIGYGMNEAGNSKMREIHGAMTGLNMNDQSTTDEAKGFFPTSDNAIDGVFDKIADEILDSYPVNNIDLNINFTESFSLDIGGNKVRINNVNYKKVSENSNGKIRYEADDVPFQFIVKGDKSGFHNIYSGTTITFPWKGETIAIKPNKPLSITIKPNELPTITAKLVSEKAIKASSGDEVKLKYQIDADDFIFNDNNNLVPNDIVIVLDVSKEMSGKINYIKNAIWNKLLNNETMKLNRSHYGIVTYSSQVESKNDLTDDITNLNDNFIKNININNSNGSNIGKAFESANLLLEKGRAESRKSILFISMGKTSYSENEIEILKDKNYNIVSLAMDDSYNQNSLFEVHQNLNGKDDDYFYVKNSDYNSIENSLMALVADRFISTTNYKPYDINVELNINLGGNFIKGAGIKTLNGEIATINVPKVRYNHTSNGKYVAEPINPLEFTVIVKENKVGELTFGNTQNNNLNKISYKKLVGGIVQFTVETPKITVKEPVKNLSHGLYNGIKNNEVEILKSQGNGFEIAAGATVNFGAKYLVSGKTSNFILDIDEKFEKVNLSDIKVFKKVNTASKVNLVELTSKVIENTTKNNSFDVSISDIKDNEPHGDLGNETEIVVIYSAKVKANSSNEIFENNIKFSSDIYDTVKINTPVKNKDGSIDLPDLF